MPINSNIPHYLMDATDIDTGAVTSGISGVNFDQSNVSGRLSPEFLTTNFLSNIDTSLQEISNSWNSIQGAVKRYASTSDAIATQAKNSMPETEGYESYVKTKGGNLNLRDANGKTIGKLSNGTELTIIDDGTTGKKGYIHIKTADGREGWVYNKYVSNSNGNSKIQIPKDKPTDVSNPGSYQKNDQEAKQVVTAKGGLRIRSAPNGKILGKLDNNTEIEVIGKKGNWSVINYNGEEAYVYSKYLTGGKI